MPLEVIIRDAKPGDADQLADVHRAAWRAAYRGVMTDEYLDGLDVGRMAVNWRRNIGQVTDGTVHLVAEIEGSVRGFASCGPARESEGTNTGQLYALNVHPDTWSRGVGSALFGAAEAVLVQAAYAHAYLWVEQGNDRAIRFYTQRGWLYDGAVLEDSRFDPPISERRHSRDFVPTPAG